MRLFCATGAVCAATPGAAADSKRTVCTDYFSCDPRVHELLAGFAACGHGPLSTTVSRSFSHDLLTPARVDPLTHHQSHHFPACRLEPKPFLYHTTAQRLPRSSTYFRSPHRTAAHRTSHCILTHIYMHSQSSTAMKAHHPPLFQDLRDVPHLPLILDTDKRDFGPSTRVSAYRFSISSAITKLQPITDSEQRTLSTLRSQPTLLLSFHPSATATVRKPVPSSFLLQSTYPPTFSFRDALPRPYRRSLLSSLPLPRADGLVL